MCMVIARQVTAHQFAYCIGGLQEMSRGISGMVSYESFCFARKECIIYIQLNVFTD